MTKQNSTIKISEGERMIRELWHENIGRSGCPKCEWRMRIAWNNAVQTIRNNWDSMTKEDLDLLIVKISSEGKG